MAVSLTLVSTLAPVSVLAVSFSAVDRSAVDPSVSVSVLDRSVWLLARSNVV